MKPVQTDACNAVLTHPHADDMPVERCAFKDPNAPLDTPAQPGFESTWLTSEREREAIAAGMPVTLRIWGSGHPPVSLSVLNVPHARGPLTRDHADAAAGALIRQLDHAGMLKVDPSDIDAAELSKLWQAAIDETAELAREAGRAIDEFIESAGADASSTGDTSASAGDERPLSADRRCNCPPSVIVDHAPIGDPPICPRCEGLR